MSATQTKAYETGALIFFHPDYTVGTGISPIQSPERVAGFHRRSGIFCKNIRITESPCPENQYKNIKSHKNSQVGTRPVHLTIFVDVYATRDRSVVACFASHSQGVEADQADGQGYLPGMIKPLAAGNPVCRLGQAG